MILKTFILNNLVNILIGFILFFGGYFVYSKISSWNLKSKIESMTQDNILLKSNQREILNLNKDFSVKLKSQNDAILFMKEQGAKDRDKILLYLGQALQRNKELEKRIENLPMNKIDKSKNKCENASIQAEAFGKDKHE